MSSRAVRELFLLRVLAVRVLIIWHVMLEDGMMMMMMMEWPSACIHKREVRREPGRRDFISRGQMGRATPAGKYGLENIVSRR